MPIGKDSITKRVAKTTNEEKIAPELVATTAAAPATEKKAPAKKSTSTAKKASSASGEKKTACGEKKTTSTEKKTTTTRKKAAPKVETVVETFTPPTAVDENIVETAVLANVSPETVAAVIGHKEDEKYEKVQIGQKMPDFLL